jgi:hypothetical protein
MQIFITGSQCYITKTITLLEHFNIENVIIQGCKWNETVSNRKCNHFP